MSIFFSQIKEIFKNQTKDKDFDFILGQYKDKTFRFTKITLMILKMILSR